MDQAKDNIPQEKPATTVREVGIHLTYLSRDMAEIKKAMGNNVHRDELFSAIKQRKEDQCELENRVLIAVNAVDTKANGIETRVKSIEDKKTNTLERIFSYVVMALVLMVLAQYGIDRFIN